MNWRVSPTIPSDMNRLTDSIWYESCGKNYVFKHVCPKERGMEYWRNFEAVNKFPVNFCQWCEIKFPDKDKLSTMIKLQELTNDKPDFLERRELENDPSNT